MKNSSVQYVIVQAGGKGTRLGNLTTNKPKALLSVKGEPLLIRLMRQIPQAHFIIIGDYHHEVLNKYLSIYAPTTFTFIKATSSGTCAGISDALKNIPEHQPILVVWCDLYFSSKIFPSNLNISQNNYIGLSKKFRCRWSFKKGLQEKPSQKNGVAGVFFFCQKSILKDLPAEGEFCKYLVKQNIKFNKFDLKEVNEVGTLIDYNKITKNRANSRPFNQITYQRHQVFKKAIDEQGKKLAKYEISWYKAINSCSFPFIPKIYSYSPLTLQKIHGQPLFNYVLSTEQKKLVLGQLISNISRVHALHPPIHNNYLVNNRLAYITKTRDRINSVASLIPNLNKPYITINNKRCLNFFIYWDLVEKMMKPFYTNDYSFIHGDPTFSNTLYNTKLERTYLIDPRGYFGEVKLYGDQDYDWAKMYYSIVGNYDQFNKNKFKLSISGDKILIDIESNGWESLEKYFFQQTFCNELKIKLLHAIIWLSLTSYTWDNYDSILGAFYNGTYLMHKIYEEIYKKSD